MFDDPLLLARLQFALTASTHYLFVALTLGLAPFILAGQLRATLRRDGSRMLAVRFWGGLYVVNYGMGVLSGLVMELQLATNWSGLGKAFGYAFGAPLAVETMAAFFVESTFLGLWIFGWARMNGWAHLACFTVVTATAYASAFWVLVANGFLKMPAGVEMRGDGVGATAVLTDPVALITSPAVLLSFGHVVTSALLVGGLVVAAVSAYHLARRNDPHRTYSRGIRSGVAVAAAAVLPTVAFGGAQEGLFGSTPGDAIGTVSGGIGLAGYTVMVTSWLAMAAGAVLALLVWLLRRLDRWRWFHWPLVFAPFLPFTASIGGWVYRETGRQPWAVEGLLRTSDAITPMSPGAAALSFSAFTLAFAVLATVTYWLLVRFARRGPEGGPLAPAPGPASEPALPAQTF